MADDKDQEQAEEAAFQHDLHSEDRAGEHAGLPSYDTVPAYEIKDLHDVLSGFTNDDLRAIPVVMSGGRLEQGAIYVDLKDREAGEFRAQGSMEASQDHWYVPKRGIDYVLWNRLTGVTNPERLDQS